MELDTYLKALRECPDEELAGELGVRDNWPILICQNIDDFIKKLESSRKFSLDRITTGIDPPRPVQIFFYTPGTVVLYLSEDNSHNGLYITCGKPTPEMRPHINKVKHDYNLALKLHPYQTVSLGDLKYGGKKIPQVSDTRALAMTIEDIGRSALEKDIPLCFPRSIGTRHKGDLSRIVYHPHWVPKAA